MSISPIITFKAGKCDADFSVMPPKIKPLETPGYLYLYAEDELVHFCWRPRSALLTDPELDLVMVPTDGTFQPYLGPDKVINEAGPKSPIHGRIFVLKFSSSSTRHFFWLQSREQPKGDPRQFSSRDVKLGEIVNSVLQGEEMNVNSEMEDVGRQNSRGPEEDDDAIMEDAEGVPNGSEHNRRGSGTGGAGADATGGDIREEGEESREGGADGGRAASLQTTDASMAVQNFLNSLQGNTGVSSAQQETQFTTLSELLNSSTTIPMLDAAGQSFIDDLLINHLPQTLLLLENDIEDITDEQMDSETIQAIVESMSLDQKKDILRKVLRSPQFQQSLTSLTTALRDGGLPSIGDALGIAVENQGYSASGGGIPLGGGEAVKAFLEAIKKSVEDADKK